MAQSSQFLSHADKVTLFRYRRVAKVSNTKYLKKLRFFLFLKNSLFLILSNVNRNCLQSRKKF